jgi:uncharacterized protein YndB with AHSA1/START domain
VINVSHQISAVERRVGSRVLAAGEARTVIVSQTYHAPVPAVWDAVTSPERIARWFLPVTGELRVGGRYQLQGNAGGTIESCEPPKGFTATWEYGGDVTWIELALTPEPDGATRLVLEHIAHVDDERWAQFGPGAVGIGWDMALLGLATHLATGESKDPATVAAWMSSAEGRQFMTASSERWCEASIAAGTDGAGARAAASRTTAAYTGSPARSQAGSSSSSGR